jgi:hypothetical protein
MSHGAPAFSIVVPVSNRRVNHENSYENREVIADCAVLSVVLANRPA